MARLPLVLLQHCSIPNNHQTHLHHHCSLHQVDYFMNVIIFQLCLSLSFDSVPQLAHLPIAIFIPQPIYYPMKNLCCSGSFPQSAILTNLLFINFRFVFIHLPMSTPFAKQAKALVHSTFLYSDLLHLALALLNHCYFENYGKKHPDDFDCQCYYWIVFVRIPHNFKHLLIQSPFMPNYFKFCHPMLAFRSAILISPLKLHHLIFIC